MSKLSLADLLRMKQSREKIAIVTAYDAPSARLADAAGLDCVLVGDSAAMTVLGHDSTLPVTVEEMLMLTRAVARGAHRPLVIADLPFGTFQVSDERAIESAVRFVKEGNADAVRLEGARPRNAVARGGNRGRADSRDGAHRPHAPVRDHPRRIQAPGSVRPIPAAVAGRCHRP